MIEHGAGRALVLVPGLPGPWHYAAPAMHALSAHFRVLTLSLGRECTIEADVARILDGLNERHLERAVICGISLGGLVALRFAATYPQRTAALVLVSAPGPGATLRPHHRFYARWPWVCGPLFVLETPFRLWRETRWLRITTLVAAALRAPVSFKKIARRAQLIESTDIAGDCRRVVSPTLVVTGEPHLDNVVPVESTTEYLRAIPGARHVVLKSTGHIGSITQPGIFADTIAAFAGGAVQARRHDDAERVAARTARTDVA
jgi:pimeloyl-ACP methyl ester carboxylesterase